MKLAPTLTKPEIFLTVRKVQLMYKQPSCRKVIAFIFSVKADNKVTHIIPAVHIFFPLALSVCHGSDLFQFLLQQGSSFLDPS